MAIRDINPKTMEYYDLIAILEIMETSGYMSKDAFLDTYITHGNDSYFYLDFDYYEFSDDTMEKQDYENYCKGIKKILEIPNYINGIWVNLWW